MATACSTTSTRSPGLVWILNTRRLCRYRRSAMLTPIPTGWETSGLCASHPNPALWFPLRPGPAERAAVDICRRCPVQITCLEAALDWGRETQGVWGGLGSGKRNRLRQARSRQVREGYPRHRYTPGCGCSFCGQATGLLSGDVVNRNTEGARCGYRSSYGRGCRCPACTYVAALHTRRVNTLLAA